MIQDTLKKLNFSEDEIAVYLNLIENSPTSVRSIAADTVIGRGTVFNILKKFITEGLASYYRKGKTKLFAAADPKILQTRLERQREELVQQQKEVEKVIPELRSFFSSKGRKTKVKYYEGTKEVSEMLRDVLDTVKLEEKKEYYVYSTRGERQIIYTEFADFSEQRIKAGIHVKAIAIGKGGELRGLDERKWLSQEYGEDSSYMVIYGDKISFVTLDVKGDPVGVIIEDHASAATQKLIFKKLWEAL
ncbi:TrmB family transcriptional regulator [Patescibacteria group bacterium]